MPGIHIWVRESEWNSVGVTTGLSKAGNFWKIISYKTASGGFLNQLDAKKGCRLDNYGLTWKIRCSGSLKIHYTMTAIPQACFQVLKLWTLIKPCVPLVHFLHQHIAPTSSHGHAITLTYLIECCFCTTRFLLSVLLSILVSWSNCVVAWGWWMLPSCCWKGLI